MKNSITRNFAKSLMTALAVVGVAATSACNKKADKTSGSSELRVANGVADSSGQFPATVYAEMKGKDFNGGDLLIRNVATLVDIGSDDHFGLVLSLADSLGSWGAKTVLPILKNGDIKLYLGDSGSVVEIKGLSAQNDDLVLRSAGLSFPVVAVGVKIDDVKGKIPERYKSTFAQKFVVEGALEIGGGRNLRHPQTAYAMIAIPKKADPRLSSIKAPILVPASSRPSVDAMSSLQLVGYGETEHGAAKDGGFLALGEGTSPKKRNVAAVKPLNTSGSEPTPLAKLIGSAKQVSQELWEVKGSGLCGSSDGVNYDTGASVYFGDKMVGFAVRSTTKESSKFKGVLVCGTSSLDDMATLVVTPSDAALSKLKAQIK